jgi:hypothetical protein
MGRLRGLLTGHRYQAGQLCKKPGLYFHMSSSCESALTQWPSYVSGLADQEISGGLERLRPPGCPE